MTMIPMEATILVPIALIGISLHFLRPLQGRIILDLHKDLLKWDVQRGYIAGSVLKSLASYYLGFSFLPSVPSLDESLARDVDWGLPLLSQISSFS